MDQFSPNSYYYPMGYYGQPIARVVPNPALPAPLTQTPTNADQLTYSSQLPKSSSPPTATSTNAQGSTVPVAKKQQQSNNTASFLIIGSTLLAAGMGILWFFRKKKAPIINIKEIPVPTSHMPEVTPLEPPAFNFPNSFSKITPESKIPEPKPVSIPTPPAGTEVPPPVPKPTEPVQPPTTPPNTDTNPTIETKAASPPTAKAPKSVTQHCPKIKEMVEDYNANPHDYTERRYQGQCVSEIENSINNRRNASLKPTVFELTPTGNYIAFLFTDGSNRKYILPTGKYVNQYRFGTSEALFNFPEGAYEQVKNSSERLFIKVIEPAVLNGDNIVIQKGSAFLAPLPSKAKSKPSS